MSDTSPSPEPAPPAKLPPAFVGKVLRWPRDFLRQASTSLFGWPVQVPVITVPGLLLLALIIVPALELLPPTWADVTLTVRSRTEIVEFDLPPGQPYVWWLPAGSYSLLTEADALGCTKRDDFDFACDFAAPTAVTIKNGARALFALSSTEGTPRFTLTLTPSATAGSAARTSFELRNEANDLVVATPELLTFESLPVTYWRLPLIVRRVQIGDFLRDSVAPAQAVGGGIAPQPIMNEGDVRLFARTPFFGHDRYLVQEENFDPADVVQIPAEPRDDGRLLGLISIDDASGRGFDLTLHTDLAEVFVRRLGAEHRIGVSMWSVVANLPIWLALWLVAASLLGVANYHTSRTNSILGRKDD